MMKTTTNEKFKAHAFEIAIRSEIEMMMKEVKKQADIVSGVAEVMKCPCGECNTALIVIEYKGMAFKPEGIELIEGQLARKIQLEQISN
jgi:hypothetical protein